MIGKPTRPLRRSSPRGPTRIAGTSPSSRAATSSAPTAWCRTPVGRNAAAPRPQCSRKRAGWRTPATRKSSCWARTSIPTLTRKGSKPSRTCRIGGQVPGIRRVRFITSHPRHFTREIVQAIDSSSTLCDHVHLPGPERIVTDIDAMNREYTREKYLESFRGSSQPGATSPLLRT